MSCKQAATDPALGLTAQVVVGRKLDNIYMVMEYMEHDLKALQESMRQPFTVSEVGRSPPSVWFENGLWQPGGHWYPLSTVHGGSILPKPLLHLHGL